MHDDALLTRTFELAMESRNAGDHPFGALLAVDGEIVAEALNRVNSDRDLTAHAEMALVRLLDQHGATKRLARGTVYASTEPCPMCVGALYWAGCRRIVYGLAASKLTEITTRASGERIGFTITARQIGTTATPPISIEGPLREDEAAIAHLGFWDA